MIERFVQLVSVLVMCVVLCACEHRPLEDPNNGHYVRVYIDDSIKNVTYGFYDESRKRPTYERPVALRVVLTDPETDNVVTERFLQSWGQDERGYYIDGHIAAAEGEYNLMIYNFGTERTKIRNEKSFNHILAYTSPVSDSYHQYIPAIKGEIENSIIRYCPDHLYLVTSEPIKVRKSVGVDTLFNEQGDFFTARTIVKSYYLQIRIKGFEHINTAVSLLGGMAGSTKMRTRKMVETDVVNVFFDMEYADVEISRTKEGSTKTAVLYATFNTFGKLPNETSMYTLNFEFTRTDGTSQVESIDITSMFDEPLVKNEQWILLEKEIEIIPAVGTGGMTPDVDEWGDVWSDIEL